LEKTAVAFPPAKEAPKPFFAEVIPEKESQNGKYDQHKRHKGGHSATQFYRPFFLFPGPYIVYPVSKRIK
jgi:hypothetical protein